MIDFTRVVSGPVATQILGDFGAEVIKVERVDGGDDSRLYGLTGAMEPPGPTFLALNRNKKSIAIDLKSPQGAQIAKTLVASADVVVHNFRPGVMEGLGLGYQDLRPDNPGLVYCSISGFGSRGPLRTRAANDLSIQAYSGLLSITGEPDGNPVRNPAPVCDITAGLFAVIGILAALHRRRESGVGQEVSTSMLEGQLVMLNQFLVDYWMTGRVPIRMGTSNALGLPNEAFPTSDGWVCITVPNETLWQSCCTALDADVLAEDQRFRTLRDRYAHREELVREITAATRRFTTAECISRLDRGGVPCAPVNTIPEVAEDAVLDALEATSSMHLPGNRAIKIVPTPLHFSESPVAIRSAAPSLGQDTDAVLQQAGLSQLDIGDLRAEGIVA